MLIADTFRARRTALVAWIVGGAGFMIAIAYGYREEVGRLPGGATEYGASLQAVAEAMRVLRWPAERLDTFGGYVTYHNLTLLALALAIWGAIQGARMVRGDPGEDQLECLLATGRSRVSILAQRVAGWVLALAVVSSGIGMGLVLAGGVAGEVDVPASMLAVVPSALAALASFGMGMAIAQLVGTARSAAGISAGILTGLYLLTNASEELGWFQGIRHLSPFHYTNQSRVLVPGRSFDLGAMAALLIGAAAAFGVATWAFSARDLHSPLLRPHRSKHAGTRVHEVVPRRYVWSEILHRRLGILAWSAGTAGITGLLAWLEPVVVEAWDELGFGTLLEMAGAGTTVTDQYFSFASQLVAAAVAGYAVTQTAIWVAEYRQGCVEMFISHPVSRQRLVLERLAAASCGVLAISVAAAAGLWLGAAAVDAPVDLTGLWRSLPITLLFGLAVLGIGAILVAWIPAPSSVIALSASVFASYLLAFLAHLFDLPDWVLNLSVFGAYGRPYLEFPTATGLLLLAGLTFGGAFFAPRLAARQPKQ